ncbi:MAG: NAD(P)-dependent oxidoreductase [Candidatus Baltobacteraceae bacterium]
MKTIAFYGAGLLGSNFVRAFRRRDYAVRLWNRTAARAQPLAEIGVHIAATPEEAALGADHIHLCLSDDRAVEAVLERILSTLDPATPICDHTTCLPQRVAARTAELRAKGFHYLHAPVFMGPPNALEGTGSMLVSGDRAEVARVREHLAAMTGTIRDLGERTEAAAIYKLLGNAMILAVIGGIADVLQIGAAQGLTGPESFKIFDFYDPKGQIEGRGRRMAAGDEEATWSVEMALKDARLMQGAAYERALPVIDAVAAQLAELAATGAAKADLAALGRSAVRSVR